MELPRSHNRSHLVLSAHSDTDVPRSTKKGPSRSELGPLEFGEDYGMERAVREGDTGLHPTAFTYVWCQVRGTLLAHLQLTARSYSKP